ncbi:MAG: N-acetylmuramoyl-L-alanine amidase, partial [Gammaproteobacteria bacterium]|nr:N-acetylmuramoyl-L-alanine amidase [Gammaproteobacteria bacterium]
HSPKRTGASYHGFKEHDEAVEWATHLATLLAKKVSVDYVPTGKLSEKVAFINAADCRLAVEIHFNAAVNAAGKNVGKGSETLYYPGSESGKAAALTVQKHLSPIFSPDRGAKEGHYQMNPAKPADYFLRKTNCLALIIEPEFIQWKDSIQVNREKGCEALCAAMLEILGDS